ncbi:YdcH family protein, partial [Rodentibacter caecimuris]
NELDQDIKNKEENIQLATHTEIEILKKEKLRIKDELYAYLKKKAIE